MVEPQEAAVNNAPDQSKRGNTLFDSLSSTPAPVSAARLSEPIDQAALTTCPGDDSFEAVAAAKPTLSPISFATRQGDDGRPLDTASQFAANASRIQASFGYDGLRNGLAWERVWYFGDEEILRSHGTWDAGGRGELTVYAEAGEGGFTPGRYRLEIYVAGELLSQGSFVLTEAGVPTQRPVQVAYTNWDGHQYRIDLLDLTSHETQPLLEFARKPAWSADAIGLLFYGESGIEGGTEGLWVLNMPQQKSYQINQETFFQSIAWSPQRSYVASSVDDAAAGPHLVLWNLNENQAYPGPPGEDPAWSPEGRRLAYRGCREGRWGLDTIRVIDHIFDTDSIQPLTDGDDSQPAWSWDGQWIAFVRDEDGNQDIYIVASDGSNSMRLTNHPAADTSPAWTPDQRLLFRSLRDGQWGIYIMNADGSNQRRLIDTLSRPDWQPDRLAVSTDILPLEPTPPPPKPTVQIPPGQGVLVVSNLKNNDEMTFTIDNKEQKIGPFQYRALPLRPGHYTWTASWPGKTSRTGSADIAAGQVAYPVVER